MANRGNIHLGLHVRANNELLGHSEAGDTNRFERKHKDPKGIGMFQRCVENVSIKSGKFLFSYTGNTV